jgi:hypothetical protein
LRAPIVITTAWSQRRSHLETFPDARLLTAAKARALGTAYAARHRRRGDRKMPSRPPLLTLMRSP